MQLEEIKKLATLARLDIPTNELEDIAYDFDAILAYVGQVQEVDLSYHTHTRSVLTNVVREDIVTTTTGEYSQSMLDQMPDSQDGFLKVKQIL